MSRIHEYFKHWPRPLRWGVAGVFIVVGIIGLILPIMPGWVFIIPGVYLLGEDTRVSRWLVKKFNAIYARYQKHQQRKKN